MILRQRLDEGREEQANAIAAQRKFVYKEGVSSGLNSTGTWDKDLCIQFSMHDGLD